MSKKEKDLPESITISTKNLLFAVVVISIVSLLLNVMAFQQISALNNSITSLQLAAVTSGSDSGSDTGGTAKTVAPAPSPTPSNGGSGGITVPTIGDDPVLGDPNAPVTIYEFSDYQCPFCRLFWANTFPELKTEYIDTGKVKFVYKDYPLSFHAAAEPSAIAANCAQDQDQYWEYHDKIFEEQQKQGQGTIQYDASDLRTWAEELGLDMGAFDACVAENDVAEIAGDTAEGVAAGVRGTPGFVVGDQLISGAQPFAAFKAAIDAQLE